MFQPHRIVALAHADARLYGEVVRAIPARGTLWVRPLLLAAIAADGTVTSVQDARAASDLILPADWFAACLDTEAIPLLAQLHVPTAGKQAIAPPNLHPFIDRVCRLQVGDCRNDLPQ
ncbi:hypothetical protein KR51_00024840 [Rubidibacter lacunae KORDI 51-2]|uniref:Uncharacterized protein n=1 Tax=Rubidibacter lacunae KORDI 51-2 TaxID=582515 RepID=U5DK76_9CHRO|nr:hypothetical protein [Rubidibacter lacunae]ERN40979.1 hypothetical protein KR51_00024840 [Rubidibacter lacunae KORDI 51-2]